MSHAIAALCRRLTHGVYVIGVAHGAVHNAFTAAWVMQGSFDPLLLALAIHREHDSYRLLIEGRAFSVSVLREDQMALATPSASHKARTSSRASRGLCVALAPRSSAMRSRISIARCTATIRPATMNWSSAASSTARS